MSWVKSVPIIFEDDVWVSSGVTILKEVKNGARVVIAAGSIVTKDVPSDSIYKCKYDPVITSITRNNS